MCLMALVTRPSVLVFIVTATVKTKAFILLADLCEALLICYNDTSKYGQKHRSRFETELQNKAVGIIEEKSCMRRVLNMAVHQLHD